MARILITSGPTRQYLDPVRYLTNASSGRMGNALATAALALGHEVVMVCGPIELAKPAGVELVDVLSTEEMLEAAQRLFPECQGAIGAAAPCDYRPVQVARQKLSKTGEPLTLHLIETPDVIATLGAAKRSDQWVVGFALETEDHRFRALTKLERKHCDLIVLNGPQAMNAEENDCEILDDQGQVLARFADTKARVAEGLLRLIDTTLIRR
jgi:phosphopantothenoylcysteine decarboxylase / phosphopantothenate---cysteine ligase